MTDLLPRHLLDFGQTVLDTFPVLVIEGARQVGKSTFAQMLLTDRGARQVTLDDVQTRAAAQADPVAFVEQAGSRTLLIDEIQRVPELILAIKAAVDRDRRPGGFVLTGSADLLRLERTPDSLAGRAVTLSLHGLSQGEQARRMDDFVARMQTLDDPAEFRTSVDRARYAEILARGGYPELRLLDPRLRTVWLDSYLDRIVQRDLVDLSGRTQPQRLRSVLRLLAANQSGELVKARLADQGGIPAGSITTYLDALGTLFLIVTLPPWTPNLTRREIGRHKAFVADSALAMRLNRLVASQLVPLTGSEQLGGLVEGLVVTELIKQSGWSREEYELFHYRDRNGLEVDVVIEFGDGRVYGLEVKASKTFKPEHFAGLDALAQRLGDRFRGGIVLNTSDRGYRYTRNLIGLPIASLWEL